LISGSSVNLSAQIKAVAATIPLPSGSGGGITSVTVLPATCTAGAQYFLTTTNQVFTCGPANVLTANNTVPTGLPASGLLAEYRILSTETPASLVDYSGNGNTATGTAGTAPTIIASSGGISCAGVGGVVLPAALNGAKTILAFVGFQSSVAATPLNAQWQGIVSGNSGFATSLQWLLYAAINGDTWGNEIQGGFRFRTNSTGFGAYLSSSDAAFNGNAVIGVVLNASDNFYINGVQLVNNQSGSSIGQQSAGQLQLCGNSNLGYLNGNIYYAAFWNRALSKAEVAQASQIMTQAMSARGVNYSIGSVNTDTNDQVVLVGDSLTAGINWPIALINGVNTHVADQGVNGTGTPFILSEVPFDTDTLYHPGALRNTISYWSGTNEVPNAVNAPAIIARTRAFTSGRKALGYKVVVGTMISRTGNDLGKDAFNLQLRNAIPLFADGVIDFSANVHFGADAANANTTYYNVDGIHLTTFADQQIIGPYIIHAINRANGNTLQSGSYNKYAATGFTIPTQQQVNECPASGGASFTCTLPFNETAGNALVAVENCQTGANGITLNVPTDSRANTWNAVSAGTVYGGVAQLRLFFALNIGAGANTVTFTSTGTPSSCLTKIVEFSGVATAAALDVNSAIATGTSVSPLAGSITTTQAGNLLLVGAGSASTLTNPITGGSYWTPQAGSALLTTDSNSSVTMQVGGAAGAFIGSDTLAASQTWAIQSVALKATASTTSTYQLQDADIYAECAPSGANGVGLNLPDGAWMAGETVQVHNTQTSGSSLCTINGTTPYATGVLQQIDAQNSINVPNLGTITLKSLLTFTGVAGTNQSPVINWTQVGSDSVIGTQANCISIASPAVCGSAAAGMFVLPAAATTVTVNTTAVTAGSVIIVFNDDSLGARLGVTCNTGLDNVLVSARVAGTSFTVTGSAPVTNPNCYSYIIVN
jgi:hypothetical protein